MSGRTWDRSIAPDGTIPYRPSILDIRGAHAPLRPRGGGKEVPKERLKREEQEGGTADPTPTPEHTKLPHDARH